METKIGQVGLGAIGSIYAKHLAAKGLDYAVYDNDKRRLEAAPLSARRATGLADLAKGRTAILVSLPDPVASQAVLLGPDGLIAGAEKGAVILDTSTIDPETAKANFAAAEARGVHYIEAPVSGGEPMSAGVDGAKNANVTFMCGGSPEGFEAAKALMGMIGKHWFLLGPAGSGSIVKLISNYIAGLHNLVASEAFALGKAAGFDAEVLLQVFGHTDANSFWLFNYFAPRIRAHNFEPGFSTDLQYKDLRLCEDLARSLKVPMPLNGLALQIYQILRANGRGGKDLVDSVNLCCENAGIEGFTS